MIETGRFYGVDAKGVAEYFGAQLGLLEKAERCATGRSTEMVFGAIEKTGLKLESRKVPMERFN